MQFYYIRHAQSSNNALWAATGASTGRSADPELTELGYRQASRLAGFLNAGNPAGGNSAGEPYRGGFEITHLYASLMLRAVQTGTVVAEEIGLPLIAWEDIHEQGGIYVDDPEQESKNGLAGCNRSYFQEHFPDFVLPSKLGEAGWWNFRPHETSEGCQARASRFLGELLERHGDSQDRVAIISHGGFYNDFLAALLNLPRTGGVWFRLNNAAITRIDFLGDRTGLVYMNRMDYLPTDFIT